MPDRAAPWANQNTSPLSQGQMETVFDDLMAESRRQLALASRQLADRVNRFDAASALLGEHTRQLQTAGALLGEQQRSVDASAAALDANTAAMERSRRQLDEAGQALAASQRACDGARQVIEQLMAMLSARDAELSVLRQQATEQTTAIEEMDVQRIELERWTRELHDELSRLKARRW